MDEESMNQEAGFEVDIIEWIANAKGIDYNEAKERFEGMSIKKQKKRQKQHFELGREFLKQNSDVLLDEESDGFKMLKFAHEDDEKAIKRYQKLTLAEKYILFDYSLRTNTCRELKAENKRLEEKYNELANNSQELKEAFEAKSAEVEKLKKALKKAKKETKSAETPKTPTKRKANVELEKPDEGESSPTKKSKQEKDEVKEERLRLKKLLDDAPKRPPGNHKALFTRKMKEINQEVSKKEVNEAYNKLTDDEKRREKVELKKEFNVFAEDMGQYLKNLNDDDRAYVEEKFKITILQRQDFTLDELFPNIPKAPSHSLYSFYTNVYAKAKIDEIVAEKTSKDKSLNKFAIRGRVGKELFDGLEASKLSKVAKKFEKAKAACEANLSEFYRIGELNEDDKISYDRIMMKKKPSYKPDWLAAEPKGHASPYALYSASLRDKNKDEWEGKVVTEVSKITAMTWKELSDKKKTKVNQKFEAEKEETKKKHEEWLNSLSQAQRKFHAQLNEGNKMKGDRPPVAMARKADDILIAISSMSEEEKVKFIAEHEDIEAFKKLYIQNIGIPKKSESTRTRKWQKMINGDIKAVVGYLTTLSKTVGKKKNVVFKAAEEVTDKPVEKPVKKQQTKVKKPSIGSKKWRELVDQMAPGHPKPPKGKYGVFRGLAKAAGLKDPVALKAAYADENNSLRKEAEAIFQKANEAYKEEVHVWLELVNAESRREYEFLFMRGAKPSEQKMIEGQDLSYLDIQPKTPAYQMCAEDEDSDDGRIEELPSTQST